MELFKTFSTSGIQGRKLSAMSSALIAKKSLTLFEPSKVDIPSQQLPLENLQTTSDLAKTHAARHSYSDAIELFDYALSQIQPSITSLLLANRAATYLKAGQYDRALSDANRAIELSPQLPDGYVQAAAVFLSQNQSGKALTTYMNLLEHVPDSNPHYGTFLARKEVLEQDVQKRNNHLLQRFPREVLDRIFSYLSIKDWINCASTCKAWRSFFDNWSLMFRELDLRRMFRPRIHLLSQAKVKDALQVLRLPLIDEVAVDVLSFLVSAGCDHIQSICKLLYCSCTKNLLLTVG